MWSQARAVSTMDCSAAAPLLKPETALTTSFGIGWTPSFVPGFRVQIDYYNIKIEGVIQGLGGGNILNQCLTNNVLCGNIHRDQFGSLWLINSDTTNGGYVIDPKVNNGSLQEQGVDLDLSYTFDIGSLGKIRTALVGTYIDSYMVEPIANDPELCLRMRWLLRSDLQFLQHWCRCSHTPLAAHVAHDLVDALERA